MYCDCYKWLCCINNKEQVERPPGQALCERLTFNRIGFRQGTKHIENDTPNECFHLLSFEVTGTQGVPHQPFILNYAHPSFT